MNGVDRLRSRKSLKERLGLGCCGATWVFGPSTVSVRDDEDDEGPQEQLIGGGDVGQSPPETESDPDCVGHIPGASGMNLAAALAAERHFRATQESDGGFGSSPSPIRPNNNGFGLSPRPARPDINGPSDVTAETSPGTPLRVSLMRLLEESDGCDGETGKEENGAGSDSMCCVCMRRNKGAAFIPCGHTFCRVCSRELWLNRGSCPLCNRSILEILDIF
ncbi:unnamed protein product [Ilex paraguariensis]